MGWAFLTRAGSESDLITELGREARGTSPCDGVVLALSRPRNSDGPLRELCFARQAMRTAGRCTPQDAAEHLARALIASRDPGPWNLQIVAPDSGVPRDARRKAAENLSEVLREQVSALLPEPLQAQNSDFRSAQRLLQLWMLSPEEALVGVTSTAHALSIYPGGKLHLKRADDALSRSGLKLEEAMLWIGVGPEKGDLCADLGAAPGGWSQVALHRGATVIAVDPARVKVEASPQRFTHLQEDAFHYAPPETLDWLLCDMAWRPLEVAALVAKWGRRGWARQVFVNFKMPMKKRAEMLSQLLKVMEAAGWQGLRARHLYHDRDEVTVFGWLNPGIVVRGAQKPFEFRSRAHAKTDSKPRGRSAPRTSGRGAPRGGRGTPARGRSRSTRKP